MKDVFLIYCLFCLCGIVLGSNDTENVEVSPGEGSSDAEKLEEPPDEVTSSDYAENIEVSPGEDPSDAGNGEVSPYEGSNDAENIEDSPDDGYYDAENTEVSPDEGSIDAGNTEYSPGEDENTIDNESINDNGENQQPPENCWMFLNAKEHFKILDEIDARYSKIREEVQEAMQENEFDKSMIQGFIRERGVALRELRETASKKWMIPSGMQFGGLCMMRMHESILFFHRMKLRNNTYFRVDALHNELDKMVVTIYLSLNDLHLKGAYERSLTENNPSVLIYAPTFGEVEFLLKDVKYKVECRYRLIQKRLLIELVTSEIDVDDVLMTYITQVIESAPVKVSKENLGAFLSRLKTDLDKWIKDYFNDYMIYAQMDGIPNINELAKYDKEKGTALEEFTDHAVGEIASRIRQLDADSIRVPSFTFKSIHGLQIKLYDGVLNGLDSIYRRSVATGYKENDIRHVGSIVGFSNLKVIYKYEALIPTGLPPLTGVFTLLASDLAAHMELAMFSDTVDLDLEFLDQLKPESLTVEGAANIMIANFKHLLEHQIIAIMSNTLINGVTTLRSLPRCVPFIPGQIVRKRAPSNVPSYSSNVPSEGDYGDVLRSKGQPQRPLAKHPKSLMKQLNRSKTRKIKRDQKLYKKKTQTELKKYKRKNKRMQEKNKI